MIPAARTSDGTTRAGAGDKEAQNRVHWYPRRKPAGALRATALPVKQRLRERGIGEAEPDGVERMAPGTSPSDGLPADRETTGTSAAAARSDPNSDGDGFHPTGALIRQLRLTSGFSVAEFAELLRVSAATVRRWETAHGSLTLRSGSRAALRALRDVITEVGA